MRLLSLLLLPLKSNRRLLSSSSSPLSRKVGATRPVNIRGVAGTREAVGMKRGAGGRKKKGGHISKSSTSKKKD